jgi:hypothetical protein
LLWLSIWKEEIATRRNDYEDACLRRQVMAQMLGHGLHVRAVQAKLSHYDEVFQKGQLSLP